MTRRMMSRRRLLAIPALIFGARNAAAAGTLTVYTFGDSVLDCARYNAYGVHPGQLIVRNNDKLFPDFKGRDLLSHRPARLEHRAVDGATLEGLPRQSKRIKANGECVALVTIGGNDLLMGLAADRGVGMKQFETAYGAWLKALPIRPVLLGTVYDPTFGDDSRNFLGIDAKIARPNLNRVNGIIAELAARYGKLADIHGHFLTGDPSWYTHTIEPSLKGASEVRRVFLRHIGSDPI